MATQQKAKKPNIFQRIGSFFVKSWSELKKVSWPTFSTVMKNTAIVIVIVLFFSIIVLGADALLSFLIGLAG